MADLHVRCDERRRRAGVAKDRRISVEDGQTRHGRAVLVYSTVLLDADPAAG
jgi:hypothetical protein